MKRIACLTLIASLAVPAVAGSATRKVGVEDDFFSVTSLSVSKGTKVKWVWKGSEKHNVVTQKGPASFRSPLQKTGTFTYKFRKKGTYSLLCTVHAPDMKMSVTVR